MAILPRNQGKPDSQIQGWNSWLSSMARNEFWLSVLSTERVRLRPIGIPGNLHIPSVLPVPQGILRPGLATAILYLHGIESVAICLRLSGTEDIPCPGCYGLPPGTFRVFYGSNILVAGESLVQIEVVCAGC